jgi:serine/threonine protein kinase
MIGRRIGNYQIIRSLGEGGMGAVYMAEHPRIGKQVAIKVLHDRLCTDPEVVSRFFQEARAVNEIRHPNIVDIADFGETEDGIFYFVMELLSGRTLRERLSQGGALPVAEALAIARQVADALGAAHRVGIVHRDLKPDNIFLLDESRKETPPIKLFDFGIAKLLRSEPSSPHRTAPGQVMGTLSYMAPEQMEGREVDARTDIYALGVVLYEMLTGDVPFQGQQLVEVITAVLKGKPAPPSAVLAAVPPWLDRTVLSCLEREPIRRPQNTRELAGGLVPPRERARSSTPLDGPPEDRALELAWHPRRPPRRLGPLSARARQITTTFGSSFRQLLATHRRAVKTGALILVAILSLPTAIRAGSRLFAPPPRPRLPPELVVTLTSAPAGAHVVRDGKAVGITPTREVHISDGSTVDYTFHLGGFVDVQVPLVLTGEGERTVHVNLRAQFEPPAARRAPSSRKPGHRPVEATRAAPAPPDPRPAATAARLERSAAAEPPATSGLDDPARPLLPPTRVKHLGQR